MYKFDPMTDEEIEASNIIENGVYDFEVKKCTSKISKSGNQMAELQLTIWDKQGKTHTIFDYLVFSHINMNIRKISHFCKAVGLVEQYKAGEIPEDLQGYSGKAEIGYQPETPKANGGYWAPKNVVVDYVVSDESVVSKPTANEGKELVDDDIPF